jgi:N-acyl-D-aspartate/D-glutamate deacylase
VIRAWALSLFVAIGCSASHDAGTAATASASPVITGKPSPSAPAASSSVAPEPPPFRSTAPVALWIRGGDVITATTQTRTRADVLIDGERIVHVGSVAPGLQAKETIDATGFVVTPGFIDVHAHSDPYGGGEHLLAQGVTTIVVGQDGFSPAERIGSYLDQVQAARPRVNVATLVGHHTVRASAGVGADPKPSEKSVAKMVSLVDRAMSEGAFGLSTGLEYEPGGLAGATELAKIAEPVGKRGGLVMSHLRSEDDDKIDASLTELFEQCKTAKARAHVAHIKVVLGKGKDRAAQLIARLEAARAGGLEVTADIYPYTASYTTIGILFPAFAKPPNDYAAARSKQREALLEHLQARVEKRNGPDATLFGTGSYAGKTLADVARREGRPYAEVLLELGPSGASAAYFVMDETVMEALFKDKFVMVGSDGGGGGLHPRGHGSFSRVIADLVVKKELVTLEEAVRKMSSLAARTVGFGDDRGSLERGRAADIAIFAPAAIADTASFERPHLVAKGMKIVIVNGQIAYRDGRPTHARAGRALKRADQSAP